MCVVLLLVIWPKIPEQRTRERICQIPAETTWRITVNPLTHDQQQSRTLPIQPIAVWSKGITRHIPTNSGLCTGWSSRVGRTSWWRSRRWPYCWRAPTKPPRLLTTSCLKWLKEGLNKRKIAKSQTVWRTSCEKPVGFFLSALSPVLLLHELCNEHWIKPVSNKKSQQNCSPQHTAGRFAETAWRLCRARTPQISIG